MAAGHLGHGHGRAGGDARHPRDARSVLSLGPFRARLAVFFHGARALEERREIEAAAERFHAPSYARFLRSALGPGGAPSPRVGPELKGPGLVFSTAKPAEDGAGIVLRCYSARDARVSGSWTVAGVVRDALQVRLDETPVRPLAHDGRVVRFGAGSREVVSVLVRR